MVRPEESVSSLVTLLFVISATFECSRAGSTQITCASAFASTRHGKPSHVEQRMHLLFCGFCSSSRTPTGKWKWAVAQSFQIVTQLLDPPLVTDRRKSIWFAGGRLCRIFATDDVHLI